MQSSNNIQYYLNQGISPCSNQLNNLKKNNYLSEFSTNVDKELARKNLGISDIIEDLEEKINAYVEDSDTSSQYKQKVLFWKKDFLTQINDSNTKYIVQYDFDLNGKTVIFPENCILSIDGGSISNGTLVGNNTVLLNVNKADNILNNVTLSGTWGPDENPYIPDYNNLSLLFFDKINKKILWWDGESFVECKVI